MHRSLSIRTTRHNELIDITSEVNSIISKSNIGNGICNIYVPHATAGLTINENADPNVKEDIIKAINRIVPEHNNYLHDSVDNNAAAHIKSTLTGVSLNVPMNDGSLQLGTWQEIMLCEFDGPRTRTVLVTLIESNH